MLNNANKTMCDIHGVYGVYGVYGRPYPPITPITPIKPLNKGVAFMAFMDVGREGRPQKSHRTNRPASLAFRCLGFLGEMVRRIWTIMSTTTRRKALSLCDKRKRDFYYHSGNFITSLFHVFIPFCLNNRHLNPILGQFKAVFGTSFSWGVFQP